MRVFTFLYYEYLNKEIQKDPEFTRRLHLFFAKSLSHPLTGKDKGFLLPRQIITRIKLAVE